MENLISGKTVLVTGGTGFVGIHTILQLLQQGYTVKTTLRSLHKKDVILKALKEGGISDFSHLSFYETDLTSDRNWEAATKNCNFVIHIASPFPAQDPKDENELIIPARDGALRVLQFSRSAGVKRVVLTSSFAAVGYTNNTEGHIFTERDWTDLNAELPPYIKSKTVAEKAAWKFIHTEGNNMELTVINPVGIFGPALAGISSASLDIAITGIINGTTNYNPNFTMGVVDIRDVADIHIKAMLHPNAAGERFIATSEGVMSFYDVAELIKEKRSEYASNIKALNPIDIHFYKEISNEKARSLLGWNPRSREEAILASADSLMLKP